MRHPSPQLLLDAPYCGSCFAATCCPARGTADACLDPRPPHLLHPEHPDLLDHLARIGGLDFNLSACPQVALTLPPYIPRIEPRGLGRRLQIPAAAVALKDVVGRKGGGGTQAASLRRRLHLGRDTLLILLCFGEDQLLENTYGRLSTLAPHLAAGRFDLVIAPGFSVYWTDPPMENLVNLKRGLYWYHVLQSHGINAVPTIAWRFPGDIDRWAAWLGANPSVPQVAVDLQDCRSPADWLAMVEGFRYLVAAAPEHVHFIVNGVAHAAKIRHLAAVTNRLTFVTEQAFMKATKGQPPPGPRPATTPPVDWLFQAWQDHIAGQCLEALRRRIETVRGQR